LKSKGKEESKTEEIFEIREEAKVEEAKAEE
jgi:hypothetical protein